MLRLANVRSAALVMAHPDDETLWCGGLLYRTARHIRWTVICCTVPRRDPERADQLEAACGVLGVHDVRIIRRQEPPATERLTLDHLADIGSLDAYDAVVTHGPEGEYGHVHHMSVGEYVSMLRPDAVRRAFARPADYTIELTMVERKLKLAALRCYNHVLPYEGRAMPKWEALLLRYEATGELWKEGYDGLAG